MRIAIAAAVMLGSVQAQRAPIPAPMKLTIPAFADGAPIPVKYAHSQETGSVSPAIRWSGAPMGTASFALILHDTDVNTAGRSDDTLHWLIFNIPGTATGLAENVPHNTTLEDGSVQLKYVDGVPRLAIGFIGYFGPSPPPTQPGTLHHYMFELYALDTKLDAGLNSRDAVMKAMAGHILAKGTYFSSYARP
jgi:Raf kinase inhibitor-like YbhB/YbcL family protein